MRQKGLDDYKEIFKEPAAERYLSAAGRPITCLQCRHELFQAGNALLNSRGRDILRLGLV